MLNQPIECEKLGALGLGKRSGFSHIELSYVVSCYFNQSDTASLTDLLRHYSSYAPDILDKLQFVIVDDGSPLAAEIPNGLNLNLLLLRITKDIPWNISGARNLGAVYARSDKILLTDLDHEFPEETFRMMIKMKNPGKTIYTIRRVRTDGSLWNPHSNTFFLSRGRFLELYGYDEEFSGRYGAEDRLFKHWQEYHGTRFSCLPKNCFVCIRPIDLNKSYHSLERDRSINVGIKRRKLEELEIFGSRACHSRKFLSFPFEVVVDLERQPDVGVPPKPRHSVFGSERGFFGNST